MVDVFRPTIKGKKATHYYGKVQDPKTKKWKKVTLGVTDKQVARQKLREIQVRTERVAYGMMDPLEDTPVLVHVADFMRQLEQQGRCAAYRLQTECQILKLTIFCAGGTVPKKFDRSRLDEYRTQAAGLTLNALTADKVEEFMASLPAEQAARTRNGYRGSIINLFNFLISKRKLAYNPLLCVTRHEGEQKRKRRALLPEQLQALFDAAKARPLARTLAINRGKRKGLMEARVSQAVRQRRERDGFERALIYMAAFFTGFRRKELRSMRVKHLTLDAEVPHIHLPGSLTKNGKDAKLPLSSAFAEQLRSWVVGRLPDDTVFRVPKHNELLKALKKDLVYAGIPYQDDLGRVFDFHSLRKSLGTHLRRAKVDPSVSQLYMRHSDIRLTMETYNDDQLHDLNAEVVAKLPEFAL